MRLRRREKCVNIREPWEPMLDLNERVAGGREAIRPGAPSRRETQGNLFRVVDRHLGWGTITLFL